jgi:hypothetical protein
MTFISRSLIAAAVIGLLSIAPAMAAVADFEGAWKNADPTTRGISQVTIRTEGQEVFVHAFGKCHPRDCDWGEADAQMFSPNVSTPIDTGANAAIIQFKSGATETLLMLQVATTPVLGQILTYRSFTVFNDGSSRSNYVNSGHFERQ